jgi:predicted dehydrogenase
MSIKKSSRRNFLRTAGLAGAGFVIVPRHVLGRGYVAPSDKLNIAGIGAGGKGASDLSEFAKGGKANIVAFADVDEKQAAGSAKRFSKAKVYFDYREMLEKEKDNIDAVSVSTPDNTHAVATMAAIMLGKHVYVQKPLTHDIYEARMLTEAARKYKVVTQMGNQGGSGEGVRKMQEMYQAGLIGDVSQVYAWTNRPVWPQGIPTPTGKHEVPANFKWDLWLGPAQWTEYNPAYHPFNWRGWWAFGTGALGDMACHILDPAYRILPILYPNEVECSIPNQFTAAWSEAGYVDSCPPASIIHLNYPRTDGKGNVKLTWMDGGLLPQRPDELLPEEELGNWDGGILFVGSKGKILADCYGDNPRLLPTKLMKEVAIPSATIKRVPEGHYQQWVDACIAGYGNAQTSSHFDFAGPFTESVLIANLAIRSWMMKNPKAKGWGDKYLGRKKLLWDAQNMRITNFDAANQYVKRTYREGWSLGV